MGKSTISSSSVSGSSPTNPLKWVMFIYSVVFLLGGGYFCYISFDTAGSASWDTWRLQASQLIWTLISLLWMGSAVTFVMAMGIKSDDDSDLGSFPPRISLLQ